MGSWYALLQYLQHSATPKYQHRNGPRERHICLDGVVPRGENPYFGQMLMNQDRLTREQQAAVSHRGSVAYVIAGAGTGKTKTLCERIAWLVGRQRRRPERIAVTTFTKKATAELFHRARQRIGDRAAGLRISTIDSLISDLASEAAQKGWLPRYQMIGGEEQRVLLRECALETWCSGQKGQWYLAQRFKEAKGIQPLLESALRTEMAATPEERHALERRLKESLFYALDNRSYGTANLFFYFGFNSWDKIIECLKACVERYRQKTKELGFIDYDELRRSLANLLRESPVARREFTSRFDAVLVDEFQDTSQSQLAILRALAGKSLWAVGDPCQQIYEWRGASPEIEVATRETGAKRYFLTRNFRSTQPILDTAYRFLSRRLPTLKQTGALKHLQAARAERSKPNLVYRGTTDQALQFISTLLRTEPQIRSSSVAILCRSLTPKATSSLEQKAQKFGLKLQFHATSAQRTMEQTILDGFAAGPPSWRPPEVLNRVYRHPRVGALIRRALRKDDFAAMRGLRPLAMAADAVDRVSSLSFDDAWPALEKTQDRDVATTAAVASDKDAVQVMTIHAAKGLEFPIVLVMKLGKSFPKENSAEDARLAYVAMTRAQELLVLVHAQNGLSAADKALAVPLPPAQRTRAGRPEVHVRRVQAVSSAPLVVAATHLDLYTQCPLRFAAYHEGRFLPLWSKNQSMGSRMHKALDMFLSAWPWPDGTNFQQFFQDGLRLGDSPLRSIPRPLVMKIEKGFEKIAVDLMRTCRKVVRVESHYHYVSNNGMVDGVIDALVEDRDGALVLKEWKTYADIPEQKIREYTLQASAGLMGIDEGPAVDRVDLVPVFAPEKSLKLRARDLRERAPRQLEEVFAAIARRRYEAKKGPHCKMCPLKRHCPAW
jgi:superfamily I DNA/RNA helicase